MISSKILKQVVAEARPVIERMLDDAEFVAGLRDVITANGGDWSSLKSLIKAQVQDDRDEAGDGKRVRKILDKADYSAAYADMLGLGKMNENIFSADVPHDPETGEIIEIPAGSQADEHGLPDKTGAEASALPAHDRSGPGPVGTTGKPNTAPSPVAVAGATGPLPEITACLDRRVKPPPELHA